MTARESLGYGLMGFGPALSMFRADNRATPEPSRGAAPVLFQLDTAAAAVLARLVRALAARLIPGRGRGHRRALPGGARLATPTGAAQGGLLAQVGCARRRCATRSEQGCAGVTLRASASASPVAPDLLLNPLADIADAGVPPGVVGTAKSIPESFILASALTTAILTALHTLWSVVAFQALCLQRTRWQGRTKRPFGKGTKHSGSSFFFFFVETRTYINGLRDPAVTEGLKKNVFIGFWICMASTERMFDRLVSQGQLKYLLTHKLSQDYGENFFESIRG
ncbi:hypothetical protein HPB51_027200 [Rhipicephalus microplus]|uniref:Uncharacterized protein n=1 Tax=Rhipicephalus microplus TaxID=6941 RepID=A0A9J6D138_RHIMP|nr:hypothetical protein HPB51_027200 [Rhipicephalus microplus]